MDFKDGLLGKRNIYEMAEGKSCVFLRNILLITEISRALT